MTPRPFLYFFVASSVAACSTTDDPMCRPCETGGCPELFECAVISGNDGVCVQLGQTLASCNVDAGPSSDAGSGDAALDSGPDAGPDSGPDAALDSGPDSGADTGPNADSGPDAGSPDTGPDARCPDTVQPQLTWAYSAITDLCFTLGEVTAEQFASCRDVNCTENFQYFVNSGLDPFCNLDSSIFGVTPMNCIRGQGASDFCTFVGGRLPTQAEWQAEASANGTRTYPWGDEPPDCSRSNFDDGSPMGCNDDLLQVPCEVPAGNSGSGLCDMAGNVREFAVTTTAADELVVLGGSLSTPALGLRVSAVTSAEEFLWDVRTGFRCVKAPL